MSTPFLEKSKESLESAQFLIDKGNYNSSIHCAYYSCVQVLLYVLHNDIGLNDKQLGDEVSQYIRNRRKGGSHAYYINRVIKDLESENRFVSRLNTKLTDLKDLRVRADYKTDLIDKREANTALSLAETSINELITHYNLPKL